jgi:uncharacterized damage-inducible protein DinB
MQSVQEMLATMNRKAAQDLARAVAALGDKATWRPLDKGRSALDQVLECAGFAHAGAHIFTRGEVPELSPESFARFGAENDTPEKALAALERTSEAFAQAIRALPTEKLGDKVTLPFGGGMELSLGEVALMNHWNTVYHEGQVNYIQTLCADE